MRYRLMNQSPERQQYDALLLALEAPAGQLARMVVGRVKPADQAAIVEQLRYLAALIEAQRPGG